MAYSLEQFTNDIQQVKPRVFDTYILAPFLIYTALRTKGALNRWSRRALFTAGIFTIYRNYAEYHAAYLALKSRLTPSEGVT